MNPVRNKNAGEPFRPDGNKKIITKYKEGRDF